MSEFKRPMLAFSETPDDLSRYSDHLPLLGSFKLDGIRAINLDGRMVSRSLKPIPSSYAQKLAMLEYQWFDGELLCKPKELASGQTIYHETFSAVMTDSCEEPLDWWVFDYAAKLTDPYLDRLKELHEILKAHRHPDIKILEQRVLSTPEQIAAMEAEALEKGFEGLIVRKPEAPYHCNRSSWKQGYLMKVVRTLTSEAEVLDLYEMMQNDNEATIDARGFTVRSTHIANLRPKGMLGGFVSKDIHTGVEFKCGGGDGLDHATRTEIWNNPSSYKGRIFKYSYKPYGTKDKPRQPKWLGWRSPIDL